MSRETRHLPGEEPFGRLMRTCSCTRIRQRGCAPAATGEPRRPESSGWNSHGGHLTHGMKLNFSGKLHEAHAYGVDPKSFLIDLDMVREKALETRHTCSSPAGAPYPRQLDFAAFRAIADEVGGDPVGRHGPPRRTRRRRGAPEPRAARARHLVHGAQDHRGPRAWASS
jgi:hypothetical protein